MNLWTPSVLPVLPDKLLAALHRDICRIRSSEWRSPKSSKTWFYSLPWGALAWYHTNVLREMQNRGWKPSPVWFDPLYRGIHMPLVPHIIDVDLSKKEWGEVFDKACPIKPEKLKRLIDKWTGEHTLQKKVSRGFHR